MLSILETMAVMFLLIFIVTAASSLHNNNLLSEASSNNVRSRSVGDSLDVPADEESNMDRAR